jgi:hypothetical protein
MIYEYVEEITKEQIKLINFEKKHFLNNNKEGSINENNLEKIKNNLEKQDYDNKT